MFRRNSAPVPGTPPEEKIERLELVVADLKDELDSSVLAKKYVLLNLKDQVTKCEGTEHEVAELRRQLAETEHKLAEMDALVAAMPLQPAAYVQSAPCVNDGCVKIVADGQEQWVSIGEAESIIAEMYARLLELENAPQKNDAHVLQTAQDAHGAQIAHLGAQIKSLTAECDAHVAEAAQLGAQIEDAHAAHVAEAAELGAQIEDSRLAHVAREAHLNAQLESLTVQCVAQAAQIDSGLKREHVLQAQLQEALQPKSDEGAHQARMENASLTSLLECRKLEMEELQDEKVEVEVRLEEVVAELANKQTEVSNLIAATKQLQMQLNEHQYAQAENSALQEQLAQNALLQEQLAQNAALRGKHELLAQNSQSAQNASLQEQLEQANRLAEQNAEFQKTIEENEEQIMDLIQQVAELKGGLSPRAGTTSTPATSPRAANTGTPVASLHIDTAACAERLARVRSDVEVALEDAQKARQETIAWKNKYEADIRAVSDRLALMEANLRFDDKKLKLPHMTTY